MKSIILWLIKLAIRKEDQMIFIKWLELSLGLITEEQLNMYLALKAEESESIV